MKKFISLVAALLLTTSGIANAAYPDRPIRFIVPFSPGGNSDTYARLLAEKMGHKLGQTIVVENKAGAGGAVATDFVSKSKPDGYTLLWATSGGIATAPAVLGPALPYRVPDDFTFIGMVLQAPHGLFISGKSPLTLKEILEQSKNKEFSYGSTGLGGASHVGMELLKKISGINALHVPYRSAGPAITDMLGGRIDMLYTSAPAFRPQVEDGVLKLLAITGEKRNPAMPNIPTFKELGIDAELINWFGVIGPAKLPKDIETKLINTVNAVLKDSDFRKSIENDGGVVPEYSGEAFKKFVMEDIDRYKDVLPEKDIEMLRARK